MSTKRRKSREVALKALYQEDLVGGDPLEALAQVIQTELLQPVLETFARDLLRSLSSGGKGAGEDERMIAEFAGLSQPLFRSSDEFERAFDDFVSVSLPAPQENSKSGRVVQALKGKILEKAENVRQIGEFSRDLISRTMEHRTRIDEIIQKFADNWSLSRMASLDRCILRFATSELLFFPEIPVNVTINEAIELAKKFSTERSCEFVNGILDKIQRETHPEKVDPRKSPSDQEETSDDSEPEPGDTSRGDVPSA